MIPLLQFDPATLTLWYDTQLLSASKSSREVGLALHYAMDGEEEWLKCLVRQQTDPWTRTRCASVASAVWHEKRHFLDFVLTNYGALRIRQFFLLYINVRTVLQSSLESKSPILVPLDRNLDALRREMMGIAPPGAIIESMARGIRQTKKMILEDRRPIPGRFGAMEVGGEAIFECIAYHVQLGKAHRVFGREIVDSVQSDNPSRELIGQKYQWAYLLMRQTGLLDADFVPGSNAIRIRDEPLIPLLYGALAGRYYGQEQTRTETSSSGHAAERLASLVLKLREDAANFTKLSTVEAWERVNDAASAIFGRSVIQEIEADFEHEARLIEQFEETGNDDLVVAAYRDFHRLRGEFIQILKDEPEEILSQDRWADSLVNRTQPFVVAAAPAGATGVVPEGFLRLSAYQHPETDYNSFPDARWWWTAMRERTDSEGELLRLHDQKSWVNIASDYAPMAKLMFDGNRMRSMVGPEIMSTKIRIERESGIPLVIDGISRHPNDVPDIAQWYYLTGKNHFRCQVTRKLVQTPHGRMLDPWDVRRRPAFLDALVTSLGGSQQDRMRRVIWRDWSPWLVCDEVGALFDHAKIDYSYFKSSQF
ncbi:hypothetical protein RWK44_27225 [Rhizobium sp. 25PS6]|uniref:hypothetical protein n=1 Tax=Rhizobium TaxID=379 RepID=UPI001C9114DB|nr:MULTISPECIES: hypothetical protein [Rhizobium]MBY3224767.1 hypothetical protein [Rhizobium laguerreae]MDU0364091.1 hypothetical protein [Rhizobium sp. 25PS6]